MKNVYLTLGAILRDQEHYIQEWLLFHHAVGVERFVLVLHRCDDRTEEKIVQVRDRFDLDIQIHHLSEQGKVQMGVYRRLVRLYGQATFWLLLLDSDEFLYSDSIFDVKEHLAGFERFGGLSVHQKVFGSDDHIVRPRGSQLEAYKKRVPRTHFLCKGIKSLFQPAKLIDLLSPHMQLVRDESVRVDGKPFVSRDFWCSEESPIHSPLCVNHYYTRSMQDWVQRYRRGSCNDAKTGTAYSVEEFLAINDAATEVDYSILRIAGRYQAMLASLADPAPSVFSERLAGACL